MLTVRDKDRQVWGWSRRRRLHAKPFSLRELTARIKAVLRRAEEKPARTGVASFGGVRLDFKRFEASKNGKPLELTPLEFQMLELLVERKGEVLKRDDFLDGVWGEDNVRLSDGRQPYR
jgi:two-component system alkaline phosphatase synthesis response regulator PhoP